MILPGEMVRMGASLATLDLRSWPVFSRITFAALPVGAINAKSFSIASRYSAKPFSTVVLPLPA